MERELSDPTLHAAYVFTRDLCRVLGGSEGLECGIVGVNTGCVSTEVATFASSNPV